MRRRVDSGADEQKDDNDEAAEEIGLPEMGRDDDPKLGAGRTPLAIFDGVLDFEDVMTGRELGVEGLAAIAGIDPIVVGITEAVAEAYALGRDEIGSSELDFEIAGAGTGSDQLAGAMRVRERKGFLVVENLFDEQRGGLGADLAAGGIDGGYASGGGEPKTAVFTLFQYGRIGGEVAFDAAQGRRRCRRRWSGWLECGHRRSRSALSC